MTVADVVLQYERRLSEAQAGMTQAGARHFLAGGLLIVVVVALLLLGWQAVRQKVSYWWPIAMALLAIPPARLYRGYHHAENRLWRVQQFNERALRRVRGDWAGEGNRGEEFLDPQHPYARDLNVFGERSLFERLSIARTGVGRRGLAGYLLNAAAIEEIRARQESVRELTAQTELREHVAALGPFESSSAQWETFARWLDAPPVVFPAFWRAILPFTAAAVASLIVGGLLGIVPWIAVARCLIPLLAFHSAAGLIFHKRVLRSMERLHFLSAEIQVVREGLELIESRQFESAKLRRISAQVRGARVAVRRLERLVTAFGERTKDWFYLPSLLLASGTQLMMAVEQWRTAHGEALRTWLSGWAEFEALNALACYAYENPAYTFPEVWEGVAHFEARAAGHPLLPHEGCVLNDISLNARSRFYIISGSNMSGKSTLLGAIGLNAVLALAGGPVRAAALSLSRFLVCASVAPVESLANGKSRFLAEVERLKQALALTEGNAPVLFLVDEIFGGTNSSDRRVAAEAVVHKLIDRGALGAISTHDLALPEIANREGLAGVNVHMGSREGGGPMDFDYLLKPGVTTEANGLAIARMAGVEV